MAAAMTSSGASSLALDGSVSGPGPSCKPSDNITNESVPTLDDQLSTSSNSHAPESHSWKSISSRSQEPSLASPAGQQSVQFQGPSDSQVRGQGPHPPSIVTDKAAVLYDSGSMSKPATKTQHQPILSPSTTEEAPNPHPPDSLSSSPQSKSLQSRKLLPSLAKSAITICGQVEESAPVAQDPEHPPVPGERDISIGITHSGLDKDSQPSTPPCGKRKRAEEGMIFDDPPVPKTRKLTPILNLESTDAKKNVSLAGNLGSMPLPSVADSFGSVPAATMSSVLTNTPGSVFMVATHPTWPPLSNGEMLASISLAGVQSDTINPLAISGDAAVSTPQNLSPTHPSHQLAPADDQKADRIQNNKKKDIETTAQLRFRDGLFFFGPQDTRVVIGRDTKAFKRRRALENRRKIWNDQLLRYHKGESHHPGDFPQMQHFHKHSRSMISEEGGIVGASDDEASDDGGVPNDTGPNTAQDPGVPLVSEEANSPNPDDIQQAEEAEEASQSRIKSSGWSEKFQCPLLRIHAPDSNFMATKSISREHLQIEYIPEADKWQAVGLGKNGFFVNDTFCEPDGGPKVLSSCATLQVHSVEFEFRIVGVDDGFTCLADQNAAHEQAEKGQMSFEFESSRAPVADREDVDIATTIAAANPTSIPGPAYPAIPSIPQVPLESPVVMPGAVTPDPNDSSDPQGQALAALAAASPLAMGYIGTTLATPVSMGGLATSGEVIGSYQPMDGHREPERSYDELSALGVFQAPYLPIQLTAHDLPPNLHHVLPNADSKKGPGRPPKPGQDFSKRIQKELKHWAGQKIDRLKAEQGQTDTNMGVHALSHSIQQQQAARQPRGRPSARTPTTAEGLADGTGSDMASKRPYAKRKEPEGGLGDSPDRPPKKSKPQPRCKTPPLDLGDRGNYTEVELQKPTKTYAWIIHDLLLVEGSALPLKSIYKRIQKAYPYFYFDEPTKGWESSVRHNLGGNDCFTKDDQSCWFVKQGWDPDTVKRNRAAVEHTTQTQVVPARQHAEQQTLGGSNTGPTPMPGLSGLPSITTGSPHPPHQPGTTTPTPVTVSSASLVPGYHAAPVIKPEQSSETTPARPYVSPYAPRPVAQQTPQQPAQRAIPNHIPVSTISGTVQPVTVLPAATGPTVSTGTAAPHGPASPASQPTAQVGHQIGVFPHGATTQATSNAASQSPISSAALPTPRPIVPQASALSRSTPPGAWTVPQSPSSSQAVARLPSPSRLPVAGPASTNGSVTQPGPTVAPNSAPRRSPIYPGLIANLQQMCQSILPMLRAKSEKSDAIMLSGILSVLGFINECPLTTPPEVEAFNTARQIVTTWISRWRAREGVTENQDLVHPGTIIDFGKIRETGYQALRDKGGEEVNLIVVSAQARAICLTRQSIVRSQPFEAVETILIVQFEGALSKFSL